jgi:hypothetical protein
MTRARYNPIKLRGAGPTASEIIIRDRDHDHFSVVGQSDEAAPSSERQQAEDKAADKSP